MSVEHLAAVLHHSQAKGTARLVLLGIANHAGDGGAWPSVATLAKYAGVTPRNVQKALRGLQELGEVRVYTQQGGLPFTSDQHRPNRYDVLVACPPWCDRSPAHRDTRQQHPALWISGVSEATPPVGGDTRGVSEATPGGVSEATPEPSIEPTYLYLNVPRSVTGPRARELACSVCSLPESECQRRAGTSGHAFDPKAAG